MIPKEVIDDIRNRARIENVISQFINVTKKGNSTYVAMCPFHDDHSPSLHISPDKQIFKCFSCPPENGSAGDVFRFVMKFNHVDYITAVKTVADMIGYQYDFGDYQKRDAFIETEGHKILNDSSLFCQHELLAESGKQAKEYLDRRHISREQIDKFQLGYNPKNNVLYRFLSAKGYKDRDIIDTNMARLSKEGMQDVFYDRLMIPIADTQGHVIGFTARSMDPNPLAKYINTAETALFKKGEILYNYHRALDGCRERKFMILAEGPMDVFAFDKVGFSNAVCSLGTNCTQNQLKLLRRITPKIMLAFDGDRAGQDAIYKTGKMALDIGFEITILSNTTKLDPDEIINQIGEQELVSMVNSGITWIDFLFGYYQKKYDLSNYSSKKEFALKMLEEIANLKDRFDRDNYLLRLSEISGFSRALLEENFKPAEEKKQPQGEYVAPVRRRRVVNGTEKTERIIIYHMLKSASFADKYKRELYCLPDDKYMILSLKIIEYYHEDDVLDISKFVSGLDDGELRDLVISIDGDESINRVGIADQLFEDCLEKIRKAKKQSERKETRKEASSYNDPYMQANAAQRYADSNPYRETADDKAERGK
ncbi:MAG: DNA primase [Erysipelotrichaceae bacterium]|nr:DNA primase [Erysipelotrichaceae bacterium]